MSSAKKIHTIIFRVTDEEWQRVETAAQAQGKEVNDWSREVTLAHASQPGDMAPSERLIYEELARVRYLLSHGFGLLASDQLSSPS